MQNKTRVTTIILVIILILGTVTASAFSDVPDTYSGAAEINLLSKEGYILGYPDGTFRPDGTITRAEFVKMTNSVFGYSDGAVSNMFSDVKVDDWFYSDVITSLHAGYLLGYEDGTFRPQNTITREEMYSIYDRILKLEYYIGADQWNTVIVSDPVSSWAKDSVSRCVIAKIAVAYDSSALKATEPATRTDVAKACVNVLKYLGKIDDQGNLIADNSGPGSGGGMAGGGPGKEEPGIKTPDAATKKAINETVSELNRFVKSTSITPALDREQTALIDKLIESMESYLADYSYDVSSSAEKVKQMYYNLSVTQQKALEGKIKANVDANNLLKLQDFFGIKID